MLLFITVLAVYIAAAVMGVISKKRNKEFENFLRTHADEILNGNGRLFNGRIYRRDTRIVRYHYCVSIIVMTFTRETYYEPVDDAGGILVFAFLISLLTGWWGFPWGPVFTIRSFVKNAGDNTITVGELYNIRPSEKVNSKRMNIKCPKCGGITEVTDSTEKFFCHSCGCGYRIAFTHSDDGRSMVRLEILGNEKKNSSKSISGKVVVISCLIAFMVVGVMMYIINT